MTDGRREAGHAASSGALPAPAQSAARKTRDEQGRASRHVETLLAPSEPFRIVADPAAPPARFALREGWTWVGDESEPALPAAIVLRRPNASLIATHDTATAEAPPRVLLVALPATASALLRAARSRIVRTRAQRFSIPLRFVPLRN